MTCNFPPVARELASALRQIVGPNHVIDDPALLPQYEQDWTGRFRGEAMLAVRPADTREVAAVVRACADAGIAVVPQGGNTGLVGGGVPRKGEVVVSLTRLSELGPIEPGSGYVEAGAGVTLAALQEHARRLNFDAGVDFAARDAATVGGLVACDAGGLRAMRYGTTRARVAGLEVVLADGSVLAMRPPVRKDNAGYALPSLMIGSEGTLGIITRVRWRLEPRLTAKVTALVPVGSVAAAVALFSALRPHLPALEAAEFTVDKAMRRVVEHLEVPAPFPHTSPAYVLLECAAQDDPSEAFLTALESAGAEDALVATDTTDRERLWRFRESHSEAIAALSTPLKFDVGVPLHRLAEFVDRVPTAVSAIHPDAATFLFGHLGDGNVHVNVVADEADYDSLGSLIYGLAVESGGTISAEHGIGVEKARWLHLMCEPAELSAMTQVKRAFDPANMLNPGIAIPAGTAAEAS